MTKAGRGADNKCLITRALQPVSSNRDPSQVVRFPGVNSGIGLVVLLRSVVGDPKMDQFDTPEWLLS